MCPCWDEHTDPYPPSIWKDYARHDPQWLYYCEPCKAVRCARCSTADIVSRFCPTCFGEVTPSRARAQANKCVRNCAVCPKCHSNTTVGSKDGAYTVSCPYCDWKSDHTFNRHAPIAQQVFATEGRFHELQKYYKQKSIEELIGDQSRGTIRKKPMPIDVISSEDKQDKQSESESEPVLPLLRNLRAKKSRKCAWCKHTLVKPDPSPNSTKSKSHFAINYVPQLVVTAHEGTGPKPFPKSLPENTLYTFRLTVTNPLPVAIKVNLATLPMDEAFPHKVTILSPAFDLGPSPQSIDELSLVRGVPSSFIARQSVITQKVFMEGDREAGTGGFYERGANWACILAEVVPSAKVDMVDIPVLVRYSYSFDDETVDVSVWTLLSLASTTPSGITP